MRIIALLLFFLWFNAPGVAQEIAPADREKLRQAEKVADVFVEHFRQTLDFGTVWKEFRSEKSSCRLVKSDLVTSISDEEKLKLGNALLERAYVSFMNSYYLKAAHDLSITRMDSGKTEEQITPKEILKTEASSVYTKTNGKSPETAKEIEEFITAHNRLAKLYRKYMPRYVMKSAAWKANYRYLTGRGGITHLGVSSRHPDFCIPNEVKYYIVDRGLFYFYMVEENGRMKVFELGVGD